MTPLSLPGNTLLHYQTYFITIKQQKTEERREREARKRFTGSEVCILLYMSLQKDSVKLIMFLSPARTMVWCMLAFWLLQGLA